MVWHRVGDKPLSEPMKVSQFGTLWRSYHCKEFWIKKTPLRASCGVSIFIILQEKLVIVWFRNTMWYVTDICYNFRENNYGDFLIMFSGIYLRCYPCPMYQPCVKRWWYRVMIILTTSCFLHFYHKLFARHNERRNKWLFPGDEFAFWQITIAWIH